MQLERLSAEKSATNPIVSSVLEQTEVAMGLPKRDDACVTSGRE